MELKKLRMPPKTRIFYQLSPYVQVGRPPDGDDAFKKTPLLNSHMAPQQEWSVKSCKAF